MSVPQINQGLQSDAIATWAKSVEDSRKRKLSESPTKKLPTPESPTKDNQSKKLKTEDSKKDEPVQKPAVAENTSDDEQALNPPKEDGRDGDDDKKEVDPNIYVLSHMAKMTEDGPNVFISWADEISDMADYGGFGGNADGEGMAWFKPHILDVFERQVIMPEDEDEDGSETDRQGEARYWCLAVSEETRESEDWTKIVNTEGEGWWYEFTLTKKKPEGTMSVPVGLYASKNSRSGDDMGSWHPRYSGIWWLSNVECQALMYYNELVRSSLLSLLVCSNRG